MNMYNVNYKKFGFKQNSSSFERANICKRKENKPDAQAAGADPSQCTSTNRGKSMYTIIYEHQN